MGEKTTVTKTSGAKGKSISTKPKENLSQSINSPMEQILHLQQTMGNQTIQRLIKSGKIQAKLKIGKPNDKYEQEADRIADRVMSMPEPKTSSVQRKSDCPDCPEREAVQPKPLADQITPLVRRQENDKEDIQSKLERQVDDEEETQTELQRQADEEEPETLRSKAAGAQSRTVSSTVESRIQSLKGGGQPLPKTTRDYFEPRFGTDFGQVRVHTDSQAAETATSINARAYNKGRDVVFGAGQYSPGTSSGKRLLAHELTHVLQQSGNRHTQAKHRLARYIQRSNKGTGIAAKVTYNHFVTEAKKVERDWDTLSRNERAKRLLIAANKSLKKVRVPPIIGVVLIKSLTSWEGEFDQKKWKMVLSEDSFASSTIIKKEMAAIVEVVYHEARHAEQFYRVARLEAGKNKTARQIERSYNLNPKVACHAKRNPLRGTGRLVQEAKSWSKSYSSKRRTIVYNTMKQKRKKYTNTVKYWKKVSSILSNAKKSKKNKRIINGFIAQEFATRRKMIAARKEHSKAYKDYRELPEEKEAYLVGGLAKVKYLRTPNAPQKHFNPKPPRPRLGL